MKKYFFLPVIIILITNCSNPQPPTINMQNNTANVFLVKDTKAQLGEGAVWNHKTRELYYIDIEGMKLFIYHPKTKKQRTIQLDQRIGTVVPSKSGEAIVALQNGIFKLNLETEEKTLLVNPEAHLPDNRFNDGKCDPGGRLWVGSMAFAQTPHAAALYRIEPSGVATKMLDSITISNGIVWSHDHKKMYYIDTPTMKVKKYDYDKATGEISNEEVAVDVLSSLGYPDGMTIDEEGMIWIGLWNGNAVGRWNPETGELLSKIDVPAHNVTSCAFGGKNLDTLFITTASLDMTPAETKQFPNAGGLFAVVPGVKGVKAYYFGEQE